MARSRCPWCGAYDEPKDGDFCSRCGAEYACDFCGTALTEAEAVIGWGGVSCKSCQDEAGGEYDEEEQEIIDRIVDASEPDYGGAFDGFTVTSDADPGL